MNKKQSKRQRDIKTKLMAAICMLLVSSIMMVSTTYAWFTLSTAPEVTGITTAVGANGNLEMALQPMNGDSTAIKSEVGDSVKAAIIKNTTWGNLVDVSDNATYGLNQIMLYPAALNAADGVIAQNPLATPAYGADGRITALEKKTITGVYNPDSKFLESYTTNVNGQVQTINNAVGVRAIGVSSGMSDRQLAFRAALQAANNAASQAKRAASQSLNAHGAALADIAIKHATSTNETYTAAELKPMQTIINSLLGYDAGEGENVVHTTGALEYIEEALIKYALVVALNGASDDAYAAVQEAFDGATLDTLAGLMTTYGVSLTAVSDVIDELQSSITKVSEAQAVIDPLANGTRTDIAWGDFSAAIEKLANPNQMVINGIEVQNIRSNWLYNEANDGPLDTEKYYVADGSAEKPGDVGYVYKVKDKEIVSNMSRLVSTATKGINLVIRSGAGVYADVADFCGDYSAAITLDSIEYNGLEVENLDANMSTKTNQTTPYLSAAQSAMPTFNAGASGASSAAISDFYGYIIDLAFRTNVANSNLLLQGEAVDRIYTDSTNTETMGHGATMTFKSTVDTFTVNQVKSLMNCIRVVFFDTDSRTIVGYARLDMANAELNDTTAELTATLVMTEEDGKVKDSQAIMALEQNTIHELSVMVYLDGETITNADVANGVSSMAGKMSLQFASDANLDPMDYTALKEGTGEAPANPEAVDVTANLSCDLTGGTVAFAKYGTFGTTSGVAVQLKDGSSNIVSEGTVTINSKPAVYSSEVKAWVTAFDENPGSVNVAYSAT